MLAFGGDDEDSANEGQGTWLGPEMARRRCRRGEGSGGLQGKIAKLLRQSGFRGKRRTRRSLCNTQEVYLAIVIVAQREGSESWKQLNKSQSRRQRDSREFHGIIAARVVPHDEGFDTLSTIHSCFCRDNAIYRRDLTVRSKAEILPEDHTRPLVDALRDEAARKECVGTLPSALTRRKRREEVEDVVEEFEGEFVEHRERWSGCGDVERCQ
jgi:hypothetical protein